VPFADRVGGLFWHVVLGVAVTVKLYVFAAMPAGVLTVNVVDCGGGLPPELVSEFEPKVKNPPTGGAGHVDGADIAAVRSTVQGVEFPLKSRVME
jgi:hypothetical protein